MVCGWESWWVQVMVQEKVLATALLWVQPWEEQWGVCWELKRAWQMAQEWAQW
jgi:hypothetical protein